MCDQMGGISKLNIAEDLLLFVCALLTNTDASQRMPISAVSRKRRYFTTMSHMTRSVSASRMTDEVGFCAALMETQSH